MKTKETWTTLTCDRCGEFVHYGENPVGSLNKAGWTTVGFVPRDLCPSCSDLFSAWIKGGKQDVADLQPYDTLFDGTMKVLSTSLRRNGNITDVIIKGTMTG